MGFEGILKTTSGVLDEARALPNKTAEERAVKSYAVRRAKDMLFMVKKAPKKFPDGIVKADEGKRAAAQAMPESTPEEKKARFQAIRAAEKEMDAYYTVADVYIEAERLVAMKKAYTEYPDFEACYEGACCETERKREAERLADEAEREKKKAKLQALKLKGKNKDKNRGEEDK